MNSIINRKLLILFFLLISTIMAVNALGKKESVPMPVRSSIKIENNECLRYKMFNGNSPYGEFEMRTKILDSNLAEVAVKVWETPYYPGNYPPVRNLTIRFTFDKGSMVYFKDEVDNYYIEQQNYKGQIFEELNIGSSLYGKVIEWDGVEKKESVKRIKKIDTRYAFWEYESLIYYGARLLNWEKPGVYLIWIRDLISDPAKASFVKKGAEKITTEAGTFDTVQVAFSLADVFLGKLVKNYTDNLEFWFEKGGSGKLIKGYFEVMQTTVMLDKIIE